MGLLTTTFAGVATAQPAEKNETTTTAPAAVKVATWNFDKAKPGTMPTDWSIRETNTSREKAKWEVTADSTASTGPNVLTLTQTKNHGATYNLAIADNSSFSDFELTVRVKAIRGDEDQGGGPIWRCKDENNYYICRFNPLESNFRVYEVVNGRRMQLQSAEVETKPGQWYTVKVKTVGSRMMCWLDGKLLLKAKSEAFKEAGMVGLWTKADAVTSFDDLKVIAVGRR